MFEKIIENNKEEIKAIWKSKNKYVVLLDNISQKINKNNYLYLNDTEVFLVEEFFDEISTNNLEFIKKIKFSEIIYDPKDFLRPLKQLIEGGQVLGVHHSVRDILTAINSKLKKIDMHKKQILCNCYQAVLDSASAAIISRGYKVPLIEDIPKILKKNFVKEQLLEKIYAKLFDEIISKFKDFEKGNLITASGKEMERFYNDSFAFVERMKSFV